MHTELRGECDYTAELDVHFPELTVQQTLDFAVQARIPRTPLPGMTRAQQATWYREALLTILSLRSARNTKIGNDLIRGVSGGERKRVSLAEAMSSWSSLHCWDNITRGLDSATALAFLLTIRQFTNTTGSATIMTMYQASDVMYDTFDKVTLLYQGQQIFFGTYKEARDYFTELGFQCPHNATTPDFLTSLTHPVEAMLLVRQGYGNSFPRTSDEFRQAWLNSQQRKQLCQQMENYETRFPLNGLHVSKFRQALSPEKFSL
jgi:ATP-binding cassette subfamily G (WHITE) protein 2 (PDR)